jgi:Thioesterase superfamily
MPMPMRNSALGQRPGGDPGHGLAGGRAPVPRAAATLGFEFISADIESLSVSFLRPVRPGRITATGRIVHRDGDLAFLEATLADSAGAVIATATAAARVITVDQARSAA